jgi:hypothetical protein
LHAIPVGPSCRSATSAQRSQVQKLICKPNGHAAAWPYQKLRVLGALSPAPGRA